MTSVLMSEKWGRDRLVVPKASIEETRYTMADKMHAPLGKDDWWRSDHVDRLFDAYHAGRWETRLNEFAKEVGMLLGVDWRGVTAGFCKDRPHTLIKVAGRSWRIVRQYASTAPYRLETEEGRVLGGFSTRNELFELMSDELIDDLPF